MPNEIASIDFNNFVGGRNSDAGPLNFPPNASLDEDNFVLNKDGSRQRRLGMDYEEDFQEVESTNGKLFDTTPGMVFSTYRWEDVGGIAGKHFLVVQSGIQVDVFDLDIEPLSTSTPLFTTLSLYSASFTSLGDFNNQNKIFSFAPSHGDLIIASGAPTLLRLEYDQLTNTISESSYRLSVRDLWGVAAVVGGVDLRSGNGISKRPVVAANENLLYNYRNQSFGVSRVFNSSATEQPIDPLLVFLANANNSTPTILPSNSDSVNTALYPDTGISSGSRTVARFFEDELYKNPLGTSHAPTGHFIIDALDRGQAREDGITLMLEKFTDLGIILDGSLDPFSDGAGADDDVTPGGATIVVPFAGRMFYGGFLDVVHNGDSQSPKLGSALLFSKLISTDVDLGKCYQEGDPTGTEDPSLVATDGGYLFISGASKLVKGVSLGNTLIIFAENGIWRISGGTETGFSALGYIVSKVSDVGCKAPTSIVTVDGSILYWAVDGIRQVKPTENGTYISENITNGRLQNFYSEIPEEDILLASGQYDSLENKVRWVYGTRIEETGTETKELILDLNLSSYYTNTITKVGNAKLVSIFKDNPFKEQALFSNVVDGSGNNVVDGSGNQVVISTPVRRTGNKELGYITVTDELPVKYTFSLYRDEDFIDWKSEDSVGVDAMAYLLTGYTTGEELQRNKKIENLLFKFKRTETGFEADGDDLTPLNPSSCIVQAQWGWTDNSAAGRWGREFQAYKYKRHYFASGVSDPYETGDLIIESKHRPRGRGKSLSLYMRTEPLKDLHLYGWSVLLSVNSDV